MSCLYKELKGRIVLQNLPIFGEIRLLALAGTSVFDASSSFFIVKSKEPIHLEIPADGYFCDSSGNNIGTSLDLPANTQNTVYISATNTTPYYIKLSQFYGLEVIGTTVGSPGNTALLEIDASSLANCDVFKPREQQGYVNLKNCWLTGNLTDALKKCFIYNSFTSGSSNVQTHYPLLGYEESLVIDAYSGELVLRGPNVLYIYVEFTETGFSLAHKVKQSGEIQFDGLFTYSNGVWTVTDNTPTE